MEGVDIQNDMIGGEREHHRVRIAAFGEDRRGGDRGGGIAAHRLDRDRRPRSPVSSACRRAKKRKSAPVTTIGGANRPALRTRSRVS